MYYDEIDDEENYRKRISFDACESICYNCTIFNTIKKCNY